jgi:hypothetical protein
MPDLQSPKGAKNIDTPILPIPSGGQVSLWGNTQYIEKITVHRSVTLIAVNSIISSRRRVWKLDLRTI